MKDLLQPFHFQKPDRPKEEPQFDEALAEWESLYGDRPEPEWTYLKDRKPFSNQKVIVGHEDRKEQTTRTWHGRETWKKEEFHKWKWTDYGTFDTLLKQWEYHQVRYPDFHFKVGCYVNDKEKIWVRFDGESAAIWGPGFHCDFEKGILLEEFDLILKNRGINLKK